jgi:hypothetical protein
MAWAQHVRLKAHETPETAARLNLLIGTESPAIVACALSPKP